VKREKQDAVVNGAHPFQRLQTQLAGLLASASPGERLPSEPELAHQLGSFTRDTS